MKKNQRKKYRVGTHIFVADINVLKNSFAWFPKCQVLKVTSDFTANKKRYIWVESFSQGLEPKDVQIATRAQREQYKKEQNEK